MFAKEEGGALMDGRTVPHGAIKRTPLVDDKVAICEGFKRMFTAVNVAIKD